MTGINATTHSPLTAAETALAKEHRAKQRRGELMRTRIFSECEDERAAATEEWREMRNNCEFIRNGSSQAWQEATGLRVFRAEDWEQWVQYFNTGKGHNPFNIPPVPAFNLPNSAFSFNAASNSINIGIGSRIQMEGYFLEVLENSVVALSGNGAVSSEGSSSAVALNSLLRGVGVDASWGYDTHSLQQTLNFLEKIGVDTNRPFFINGTQFELQGGKLRTVGQTAQQDLQFWGFEGLNRLVARAYAQNLFNPTAN